MKRVRSALGLLAVVLPAGILVGLVAGGLAVGEAAVLEVTPVGGEALSEEIAPKAATVKGVAKVERYRLIKTGPHDVIGVEPQAPLRIVTEDGTVIEASLERGKSFRKKDDGRNPPLSGAGSTLRITGAGWGRWRG